MRSKPLYLVCNAHLDPVWLWEWEEGLAETLSTFRIAAEFCEEFEGFVFCHNEALLYEWVEEFEPKLFKKIQELVDLKRWHLMGGWYLQPDCNLPSGESFVRQILIGKRYFQEKFGVTPSTAVNLDPFGHTRGLVQILKKSGYDSYLFCRPGQEDLQLPATDFLWVGYDGSEIMAHRAPDHYNSYKGKASPKVTKWIENNTDRNVGLLLWGIGNHGGGPSRQDLSSLEELMSEEKDWRVLHGRPEDYFAALKADEKSLPVFTGELNPWAVGCYTSMAKVKAKHRTLENALYGTEKMLTHAVLQGLISYPHEALRQAQKDLLFGEFHDILPGSSIQEVEDQAVQRLMHGLEIVVRLRAKAFFALLSGQARAQEGEFPIFVYNPHPRDLEEIVVCEFQPPEPNFNREILFVPQIRDEKGKEIPFQVEKESCNIQVDQRKRVVFRVLLKAASMTRFSVHLEKRAWPKPTELQTSDLCFRSDTAEIVINPKTGLIDRYRIKGHDFLQSGAFGLLVMKDYADPWGMKVKAFREQIGAFELMSEEECAAFSGLDVAGLAPVRVVEDGPIRTVVETLFKYRSSACCLHYKIPKKGSEIEIQARVFWMEKDRMLKLSIPTQIKDGQCRGQVAYGVETFGRAREELVAQKWVGISDSTGAQALTVINDRTYGFDYDMGEIRISLLRSPAHAGHPVDEETPVVRQDRFETRIDQGERIFTFWIAGGPAKERFSHVEAEARAKNETPMALCAYPPGQGNPAVPGLKLSDSVIQLAALKMAENGDRLIIRLFEPTGEKRTTQVAIPALDLEFEQTLDRFEIKTVAVDLETKAVVSVDLLENPEDQMEREA